MGDSIMTDRFGTGFAIVSALGFGTLGIFGKLAADAGLSISTVLFFRFLLATVLVWGWLGIRGDVRVLSGRNLVVGLGLGSLGYATVSALYFLALEFLTAGLTGILLYTYPIFVVTLAVVVLDEPVTRQTLVALVVAIVGVGFITGAKPTGVDPRGVAIVLLAALIYAAYIVVSRRTLSAVDSQTLTAHVVPAATVTFLLFGTVTGQLSVPTGASSWLIIAGIAVVATVVPIFAFFAGIARIGASRASIVSTVEPAATLALGALLLGEPVTFETLLGGVLVVTGVLLVER
jgi:drug/metabolite transporter (DMT)-like permease